ncbi:MAG: CoA ester lyase, partial [Alphaproteobacteria bacterium]|nr:CoA ester lyase [Alphaproteobacteria bacterium]
MRSLLFVPADSPRKFEKALTSGADAIILDLEDSVAPAQKAQARSNIAAFIATARAQTSHPSMIVRVNALDSGMCEEDLDAVCAAAPAAIMLPKACGGADVQHLGALIAVREAQAALADASIAILPIATETAY